MALTRVLTLKILSEFYFRHPDLYIFLMFLGFKTQVFWLDNAISLRYSKVDWLWTSFFEKIIFKLKTASFIT